MKTLILPLSRIGVVLILSFYSMILFAENERTHNHYNSSKLDTLETYNLNEVAVVGRHRKAVIIGKSGISEMNLPQAVMVLDSKLLQSQQVSSISDLLKNTNGMYIMGTTGGYQEEIASRGTNITTTNTFKNGIRYYGGMKTEMSGIESAEIMKGNSALLYGNVSPGGILNLVTKKPRTETGGNISFTYGSFDLIKPTFDIYGSLNKKKTIAFRLDGSYEQANSFRKQVSSKTFYINPSILFKISPKTSVLVEADYTNDNRTPDFGPGIVNYEIADLPRSRFLGVSWGYYKSEQAFASVKATHKFSKNLNISSLTGYRYYSTDLFANSRPNTSGSTVAANGDWTRNLQRSAVNDNYLIEQLDLNASFSTFGIDHQSLIGADIETFQTNTTAYKPLNGYDKINIFTDYNPNLEPSIPELTRNTLTKNPVTRYGLYAQDLVGINKYLKLLLGARYTAIKSESNIFTYSSNQTTATPAKDWAISPKAGIIIKPSANHTLFATYSNSFALNTGVDVSGNALDPSTINQYEIGLKNRLFHEKLWLNITAYQIENDNLAQTSLANGNTNSNIKELAGATRGRGLEVDMEFQPLPQLTIRGGYSYTKTIYTKSNTYIEGSELRYNPKNTANLSFNYHFENGIFKNLQAGFISSYIGERFAGRSTRLTVANDAYKLIPLDRYLQHDILLGYTYKRFELKAKFSNITNALSYNIHDDNSLNPIAPFNFLFNIQYKF